MQHRVETVSSRKSGGFEPLQVLIFPLRASNALVLLLFTLTFSWIEFSLRILGSAGLIMTIVLFYVSCVLFFGYMFVILDFTARGHQQPPMLSSSLLQSAQGSLFKECLLISLLFALIYFINAPYWQLLAGIGMLVLLPVVTSLLVIYDSLFTALNPLNWVGMVRQLQMGPRMLHYLLLFGLLLLCCFIVVSENWGWLNPLKLFACLASFMLVFRCLGALLHDNAAALGLQVNFSETRSAAAAYREEDRVAADFLFVLHRLAHNGKLAEAAKTLEAHLKASRYQREGYYFNALMEWSSTALAVRAGVGYVDRLVVAGEVGRAWDVLVLCFNADRERVEIGQGATVFMLAAFPRLPEHNVILWHLLRNFEADFPRHPRLGEALLLAARVAYVDFHDRAGALECLARIQGVVPLCVESAEFIELARQIRS
jgi:hypothetical protein